MDEREKRRQKEIDALERDVEELLRLSPNRDNAEAEIEHLRRQVADLKHEFYSHLGAWQRVQLARHPLRPYTLDYVRLLFEDFSEIHGDRDFADDPALICGMAFYHGEPVMIIGQQKGRDTKQRVARNWGQAKPEGYRKALRVMQLAAKFKRPVFTFVDTPGAYPGVGAEERGQAEAIAKNLREMSRLPVPDSRHHHRRRRLRRRAGDCARRSRSHARKFRLLRDFAGRLRIDHVARLHESRNRRRSSEDHRARPAGNEARGRNRP